MNFLKEQHKNLLYRPAGVTFGRGSFMRRPFSIRGAAHIRFGDRTTVRGNAYMDAITEYAGVQYAPIIEIGNDVYIGGYAYFTAVDRITIGDGCVLSEHVYITDESHGFDPAGLPIMEQELVSKGPVTLGARCFLGYRSAVLPGVTLGEGCVVGANSTVTRSFPAYSMIGGSPARLLKTYSVENGTWT